MGYKIYFIFFLILIWPFFLWASDNQNSPFLYKIGFQQNLNSYQWLSHIHYHRAIFGKGLIEVGENFNSSLIRLSREDHKWRDDQRLSFNLFRPYSLFWGVRISGSAYRFSDRLSGLVSDINTNWVTFGLRLQPMPQIQFESDLGYKYDDRLTRIDRGMTYHVNLKTNPITIKDYDNQFYFLNRGDKYSIRKNNDFELQYHVKKYFQANTVDSLSVFWTKKRRDNYDLIDTGEVYIESLEEENRGLQHYLIYGSQTGLQFRFRNLINSRQTSVGKYDYDEEATVEARSKKDFHSENEMTVIFQRPYMMLNLALNYETDNQKNDVPDSLKTKRFSKYFYYISPDYQSSRLTFSTRGTFYLFKSDTLQLNGSISRYRYDTPDNNMDDRDELRLNINISEIHHFSPYLRLVSNGSVNLYHLVYIFGERSANNNWMRIFRIFPQIIYQPNEKISIEHHLEVLANYIDYDYDFGLSATDLKSHVFRRFSFTQQVYVQLTHRTDIFFNHKLEIEENGKLDWDRWTEYLQSSRENHWLRISINYRIKEHMTLAPGILFLKRIEKQQSYLPFPIGLSGRSGNLVSFGPTLKLIYRPHQKMNFSFEGMRRIVTMRSVERRFINHFDVSLTWYN